ncbi:MAG TPA: cyclic nucleotide-binding domain-containing protein [Trebonia sp.]|jgi:CRP-like cAMP-binding protein|nr:cyclic nucleotide-binding domain-containing protein [Trebonia sp.]
MSVGSDFSGSDQEESADLPGNRLLRRDLHGTLALSVGHRTVIVALKIRDGRGVGTVSTDNPHRGEPLGGPVRRLRRSRRLKASAQTHHNTMITPREVSASMDKSEGRPKRPFRRTKFWDCLSPAEKDEFQAIAIERVFARGARLMQEGESADHVMVIMEGRTEISVHHEGADSVIAQRGPGQLIGERAALQVSVRSATVIALETVQALVVRTEDFAAFVSAHPAVLEIVESQVYERLTEDPAHDRREEISRVSYPARFGGLLSREQALEGLPRQCQPLNGENCTVVVTDVAEFGALDRTNDDRRIIRQAILEMTSLSLNGIWEACSCEDRGDGLLIIVPPVIPTGEVMDHLRTMLPVALRKHNRTYAASARIALRIAVDVGPVVSDVMGVSGDAIIRAVRMRDAPVLKNAMVRQNALLGIVVSEFVYDAAVRQGSEFVDPACYQRIAIDVKETISLPAWMELVVPPQLSPLRPRLTAA